MCDNEDGLRGTSHSSKNAYINSALPSAVIRMKSWPVPPWSHRVLKDEREPDVVADDLHRAIDEEPRAGVFPLEISAVFLQFVITSSLAERAGKLHVRSKIRLDRRPAGLRIVVHPHR
jgi:hypothetical protein